MNAVQQDLSVETMELVKECLQIARQTEYAGEMQEHVFSFFGDRLYVDYVFESKMLSVSMLAALAKPEVRKVLKNEFNGLFGGLIKMFERLHYFAESMENDVFKIEADLHYLENYSYNATEQEIQGFYEKYAAKAAGLRAAVAVRKQFKTRI